MTFSDNSSLKQNQPSVNFGVNNQNNQNNMRIPVNVTVELSPTTKKSYICYVNGRSHTPMADAINIVASNLTEQGIKEARSLRYSAN